MVTLKNARSALYPVRAKWRDIGIELEIDIGTLDSIERSCHFQDNDCLTRMLDYWLKQTDPPPSWDAILEALESGPVGEGHLAEQVKQKYCKEQSSTNTKDVSSFSAVVGISQTPSTVCACSTEYVKYLQALYVSNKLPPGNKWPPSPSVHYINLALIDKQTVARHEADEFTRYTLKGNIDDICHKKTPITMENIACMQEVPFAYDQSQVEISYPKLVLVTGAPGVGKSTFAWELCRKWGIGELLQHYSLVILLRLRDKNVREANELTDLLFHRKKSVSESLAVEIEQSNGKGILFILEGFDELSESLRVESSVYLDLIYGRLLPLATVLITSRPWAVSDLHWKAQERISQQFEILGFTKQQIDEYLISITLDDSNLLDELRRYVSFNPPIHAAMYIPLNAAIVFEVYRDRRGCTDSTIPNTMTELYTAFSLTLLIRYLHDQGERIRKLTSFENLPEVVYKKFLNICDLAYAGLQKKQLIFSDLPDDFETLGFMQSVPELHFSSGVSISYNFLHLTVQEFLAAYYLSLQPDSGLLMEEKSVIRFLAGITKLNNPAILPQKLPKYSMLAEKKAFNIYVPMVSEFGDRIDRLAMQNKTHAEVQHNNIMAACYVECHVSLTSSVLLYESQNKKQLQASIGNKTAFLEIHGNMTPMECFAAGWCITNSNCKTWKLSFYEGSKIVSSDCMEMLHAGVKQYINTHPKASSCYEICELYLVCMSYRDDDSIKMLFDLQNLITVCIKRFVCLQVEISSHHIASFCTRFNEMVYLEEVIFDIDCDSVEANKILDVVQVLYIKSLKLGETLSKHFIKRQSVINSTIHSLSLVFLNVEVTDVMKFTTSWMNCKSLQFLTVCGYPFYIHTMLLEQVARKQIKMTVDSSDSESYLTSHTRLPHNSGEMITHLLQGTSSLKTLHLQNCGLGQRDITIITEAVKHNRFLLALNLSDNNCSHSQDAEVDPFADMLRVNQTLQELRLCGSNVDTNSLLEVLANNENTTLLTLDVRDNDYNVKSLVTMLRNNRSLQCLQITVITNVYIDDEISWSVCVAALSNNSTLHDLMIHTVGFNYDEVVRTIQQCQDYDKVKGRIKIHKHDQHDGQCYDMKTL